jgi:hypothetical protein
MKSSSAVQMDTREHMITLGTAVITSITLALTDYLIVRIKRAKAERARQELPEGEVIILRNPWPPDEAAANEADAVEAETEDAPGSSAGRTP